MNKHAEEFKKYLQEKNITIFEVNENDDESHTTIFNSYMVVAGQQLPTIVITDDSVFTVIRVQIALEILKPENELTLLKMVDEINRNYKLLKMYFDEAGSLYLDASIVTFERDWKGDEVYLIFDVMLDFLNENYKKIMQTLWN